MRTIASFDGEILALTKGLVRVSGRKMWNQVPSRMAGYYCDSQERSVHQEVKVRDEGAVG